MPYLSIQQSGHDLGWRELDGAVVIGRQRECDICLIDLMMSRAHCRVEPSDGGWTLVDLASKNGMWQGESRVERVELTPGTKVRIGRTHLTFHPGPPPAEGRFVSKAMNRPTDPHEALAGTVMGMVVEPAPPERPSDPWAARRAARPRPMPRPLGSGESGIYAAITETSVAVHEPSSGACALLRELKQTGDGQVMLDPSEELSVREPVTPRTRPLPRPILLEIEVATEQEARVMEFPAPEERATRAKIAMRRVRRRRSLRSRLRPTHEAWVVLLAFALLAVLRFAVGTSRLPATASEAVAAATPEPVAQIVTAGVVAEQPATDDQIVASIIFADGAASPETVSAIRSAAISARNMARSLNWETVSGAVKEYQREARRFIFDAPAPSATASTTAAAAGH